VGLGRRMEMYEPGGSIEFREMPNGAVLVDRWKLRLIGVLSDTVAFKKTEVGPNSSTVLVRQYAAESGGEMANARWRDGREWHAQLGQLRVQATDAAGKPAVGTWLMLDDSPYRARVDSNGLATFVDIVPGPYSLAVDDPALARIERTNPTNVHYTATRDSTHRAALRVPTAGDFIYQRCVADKRYSLQDSTRFLVRAMTYTGEPIGNVSWRVARRLGPGADNASSQALITPGGHLPEVVPSSVGPGVSLGAWKIVRDGGRTGTDGMFQICIGGLGRGARLLIQTSTPGFEDKSVEVTLQDALQVIRLNLAPKP